MSHEFPLNGKSRTTAWWLGGKKSYRIQYGGRGSGKTYSATEALVYLMLERRIKILCVRFSQKSLRDSVKPELERWIRWRKLEDCFEIKRDSIVCTRTGSVALFHGADPRTVESLRSIAAGIGVCYIEEAHQIPDKVWNILEPSLRPSSPEQHMELWACFNPTSEGDPIYRLFVKERKGEADGMLAIRKVNWRENPFFPEKLNKDRLHAKKHLPKALYSHVWEGELHPAETKSGWYQLIQRRMIRACMDRDWWAKRPDKMNRGHYANPTLGHDVGEPDTRSNAVVIRQGPVVEWATKFGVDSWHGVGQHCKALYEDYDVNAVYVDPIGVGQGAVSQYQAMRIQHVPVHFGAAPRGANKLWLPSTKNSDVFGMRNIQLAWVVKMRMENTWRAQQGEPIDPLSCLFINPDIPEPDLFVQECAQPTWTQVQGERKMKLDKYGNDVANESPDFFDAMTLAFAYDSITGLRAKDWNMGVPLRDQ